jgi:hypothetical protein
MLGLYLFKCLDDRTFERFALQKEASELLRLKLLESLANIFVGKGADKVAAGQM